MSLYGNELWEAVPDKHGSFSFPAYEGAYLLVIVADLKQSPAIVDSRPVRISVDQKESISIDLKDRPLTPIPAAHQ